MAADGPKTWILTGSLENFRINVERGFDVIGFKERRRRQAEEFEPATRSSSTSPACRRSAASPA